jgi:hypothetical protein
VLTSFSFSAFFAAVDAGISLIGQCGMVESLTDKSATSRPAAKYDRFLGRCRSVSFLLREMPDQSSGREHCLLVCLKAGSERLMADGVVRLSTVNNEQRRHP